MLKRYKVIFGTCGNLNTKTVAAESLAQAEAIVEALFPGADEYVAELTRKQYRG